MFHTPLAVVLLAEDGRIRRDDVRHVLRMKAVREEAQQFPFIVSFILVFTCIFIPEDVNVFVFIVNCTF